MKDWITPAMSELDVKLTESGAIPASIEGTIIYDPDDNATVIGFTYSMP